MLDFWPFSALCHWNTEKGRKMLPFGAGGFLDIFDLLPSSRKNVNFRKSDWKMGWKCQLLTFFSEFKKILWKSTQKFKIFKSNSRKIEIRSGKFEIFKISTFILRPTLAFLRYKNLKISLRGWKWGYNVNFENAKWPHFPSKCQLLKFFSKFKKIF